MSKFLNVAQLGPLAQMVVGDATQGDTMRDSIIPFTVFYESMDTTVFMTIHFNILKIKVVESYERMTLEDLIGNIGGQLGNCLQLRITMMYAGVWAGASILTVVQLVIHIIACAVNGTKKVIKAP